MSWSNEGTSACSDGRVNDESCANGVAGEGTRHINDEFAHITKLRSSPNELLGRVVPGKMKLPASTVRMLVGREGNYSGRGRFSSADGCHILSRYLPTKGPWIVDRMGIGAYVSQFSADGSLFIAGFEKKHIRVYDVDRGWKVMKDIIPVTVWGGITDTCLSADRCYLVYANLSPTIHIVNLGSATTQSYANCTDTNHKLNFSSSDDDDFGILSIKFSKNEQELVAATNGNSICVYDLGADKLSLRIPAHWCTVNTICFADESGHLIYSGGDDNLCKVWDKRCFVIDGQPAGILMGHTEGVGFIDSRGDGRYLISNGYDQTIKLWDIRKMSSNATTMMSPNALSPGIGKNVWDDSFVFNSYSGKNLKHPHDISIETYRGHSNFQTPIRCYFSPSYSTGQKYIYTGSWDSSVYIYDLASGAQVAKLCHHSELVRDCSWHPFYPLLISSSWDGDIVRWEFPGSDEPPSLPNERPGRYYRAGIISFL